MNNMQKTYVPAENRYDEMTYNRCGRSGVLLPKISLGIWHNFGGVDVYENYRSILWYAFDHGITHIDAANNYGPPYGSAEANLGRILSTDFKAYRDELFISSKAGYDMWPGPYGNWGSRKYLLSSLDQSLKRMNLEYVDVFYSHRPDPNTPLEETMGALDAAVRQGKALYAGISNYPHELTRKASQILRQMGTPCLIHQARYSMFDRWVEGGLLDVLEEEGIGCIVFSPLAQGLLTNKYLNGIPEGSRAAKANTHLESSAVTPEKVAKARKLNEIALQRGQSLAQMALAWLLKDRRVNSVLVGASSVNQLQDNLKTLTCTDFTEDELQAIEKILAE